MHHSPTDPALRANPFPEVTDQICRLPLPTLFYRLEAVHLGDLLRIWVRLRHEIHTSLPRIFKGRQKCTGHCKSRGALRCTASLSPGELIPGCRDTLQRKENSSRDFRRRLRVRLRCRIADPRNIGLSPCLRFGNINPIPFRLIEYYND